jgi:DNA-nicking Smr family endonuclease
MKRRDKKSPIRSALSPATPSSDELADASTGDASALFRQAMQGVSPLTASDKALLHAQHPSPIPRQTPSVEHSAAGDGLSYGLALEIGAGDEWAFTRPGVSRQTLRRLRRGYWKIEAQLDLHGYTRDEAQRELMVFLDASNKRHFRCVRIIHGKGHSSPNHEPVLKTRVGGWLGQRADVLAFCQARPEEGGSGAVLVLLSAPGK